MVMLFVVTQDDNAGVYYPWYISKQGQYDAEDERATQAPFEQDAKRWDENRDNETNDVHEWTSCTAGNEISKDTVCYYPLTCWLTRRKEEGRQGADPYK